MQYTPNLPVTGAYDVYMRWSSGTNRASNTPVDINYNNGNNTFRVNQQIDNGIWKYLGTYDFIAGTTGNVVIRNDSANGFVIADAVKFVLHPAPIMKKTGTNTLKIYPNPATNTIQVSGADLSGRIITIYDISGVRKMTIAGKQQTLDISFLQPGMYLLMIEGKKILTGTFIKN